MNFKEKYPQPNTLYHGVPFDVHVEEQVFFCNRHYPCVVCRTVTGFRLIARSDCLPVPCCSDECKELAVAEEEAFAKESQQPEEVEA